MITINYHSTDDKVYWTRGHLLQIWRWWASRHPTADLIIITSDAHYVHRN